MDKVDKDDYDATLAIPRQQIGLGIRTDAGCLSRIDFIPARRRHKAPQNPVAEQVVQQILAYFQDPQSCFDIPYRFAGSPFQNRVWRRLTKLKSGQTITYGELARQMDSSARAVGNACRRNPIPIVVPCHRVVSKSGYGGFSGQRQGNLVNLKQWLVEYERTHDC